MGQAENNKYTGSDKLKALAGADLLPPNVDGKADFDTLAPSAQYEVNEAFDRAMQSEEFVNERIAEENSTPEHKAKMAEMKAEREATEEAADGVSTSDTTAPTPVNVDQGVSETAPHTDVQEV